MRSGPLDFDGVNNRGAEICSYLVTRNSEYEWYHARPEDAGEMDGRKGQAAFFFVHRVQGDGAQVEVSRAQSDSLRQSVLS